MTKRFIAPVLAMFMILLAQTASASDTLYFQDDGVALRGYDAVAYFDVGAPTKGDATHSTTWQGADWHFASAENLAKFNADPEKYAPQYGGYCAYAVSKGGKAAIDPNAWRIVDDKLYLNFNQTVRGFWIKDIPGNIEKADANWPGIKADLK